MALLYDHVPFTRANGAHDFGPRNVPDGMTKISIRFGRCTTARPDLWADVATEIAAQLYVSVNGSSGPSTEGAGIGYVKVGTFEEYNALVAGGMTPAQAAAQLISEGKLIFGAQGGIRVIRGVELAEHPLSSDLPVGTNRVVTGVLAVRGGPLVTEITLEVL